MVQKTVLNREEFEVLQFRFFAIDWADRPNWLGNQGLRAPVASAREVKNASVVQNSFVLHRVASRSAGKNRWRRPRGVAICDRFSIDSGGCWVRIGANRIGVVLVRVVVDGARAIIGYTALAGAALSGLAES
jgi:hypothetical protein